MRHTLAELSWRIFYYTIFNHNLEILITEGNEK